MTQPTTYKVLITTSGLGTRLGELTEYTNKSLVRVGKKPALSYIIESYPKDIEFVITTGHYGNQVKEFVKLAYPDRKITFVDVDKYEGLGSSLGYSMLQAKDHLQCPFIFHAGDTIVKGEILSPLEKNWNGGFQGKSTAQYTSFKVINEKIPFINEKGATDFDLIHIGLVGIKDYKIFWQELEKLYKENPNDSALNDTRVLNQMFKRGITFYAKKFSVWFDVGNSEGLNYTRNHIGESLANLDKAPESIFIFDDFVIKFFFDPKIVENRVKRANILKGFVPEIQASTANFYRYRYIEGNLYSRVVNPLDFRKFLEFTKNQFWKETKAVEAEEFKKACYNFYFLKTKKRIGQFFEINNLKDSPMVINGEYVPSIQEILVKIDFDWLCNAQQTYFHGDFILDNIIKTATGYVFLDWRQDFGGLLEAGDVYYDLAKLNHNLTVNHDIVDADMFTIDIHENSIECDIMRKENLVICQQELFHFLKEYNYDIHKVKVLTALIWLNMSPLHHHPFNLFLYYFGKLNLWRAINQQ